MLIPTTQNVKTVTDMRTKTQNVLKSVSEQGIAYIFDRSKPKAVIIDIDSFAHLQNIIEDYYDLIDAQQLAQEPRGPGIELNDVIKQNLMVNDSSDQEYGQI